MRRSSVAVVASAIAIVALAFFFAPVLFWFNIGPAYATSHPNYIPVYRSASCVFLGYGDLYSQFLGANGYTFGLALGCQMPIPLPV